MKYLRRHLLLVSVLAICFRSLSAQEPDEEKTKKIESPSPDGQFAFRYGKDSDSEHETYNLIDKRSRKVLQRVAESDPDIGPSARFTITGVLWKPDSKAFAMTAFLWKRGTSVSVFVRHGSTFREVKLPDLSVEVPDKEKRGMDLQHIAELDSEKAIRWEKDGALVVQIETMIDGNEGSVTATRTVVLVLDQAGKASIKKSTVKFAVEKS